MKPTSRYHGPSQPSARPEQAGQPHVAEAEPGRAGRSGWRRRRGSPQPADGRRRPDESTARWPPAAINQPGADQTEGGVHDRPGQQICSRSTAARAMSAADERQFGRAATSWRPKRTAVRANRTAVRASTTG